MKNIFTKDWFEATGVRMARTFSQVLLGFIGGATAFGTIDWVQGFSSSLLAAIICGVTALAGLPELDSGVPYSNKWFLAAGVRALKTAAEGFVSVAGTAAVMGEVNWLAALSAAGIGAVISILMCVVSLPEHQPVNAEDQVG